MHEAKSLDATYDMLLAVLQITGSSFIKTGIMRETNGFIIIPKGFTDRVMRDRGRCCSSRSSVPLASTTNHFIIFPLLNVGTGKASI
jgi:hypothetical protein